MSLTVARPAARTARGGTPAGAAARAPERGTMASLAASVRRVPTSSILLALIGVLCVAGTVMVGSASEVVSLATYGSPWSILLRQCLWMALGAVALVVTCRLDYRVWRRAGRLMTVVSVVLLCAVLLPGVGVHVDGSSRWLGLGPLQVQPSELAKLALAVFGADLVARRDETRGAPRTIVGPLMLVTLAIGLLIVLQPDMGTAVVVGCVALALVFASGVPMRPVAKVVGGVTLLGAVVAVAEPYRRQRLLSFLHPGAHAAGSGYQVVQSLIGLGSGGVFGLGLGNGRQKWGLLPNAHTDFIFSVVGQELGLVGAVVVLLLLGALCWFGLRAATRAPDRFGGVLAVALVCWIAAESVINVGAVIGLLPVTGIPLPFISFGGSSLVITMAASGILVSIARHERRLVPGAAAGVDRRADPRRSRAV